ncbi:SAM-dependent methyltransferase [Streptomyces sp. CBMA156]|uniref:SAM-dependent methyltransferase n=1 Tax=Streptomyces sp. CBMA156 TaxID=1930280 RepID=UPI0016619547|nr:SAM-dependent methyltransferase [Streptomyces sp. CBMA156]MBD0672859.1 hypothetical protein [Streptomyces sp. CBMA156]MBD0675789.1 hypothetical protein [Streptomyces sp. CBMA156]
MTPPAPATTAGTPDRTTVDQVIEGLLTQARSCRVTDYFIGGSDSFRVDRATALAFMRLVSNAPDLAFHARAFTEHSVGALVREHGIRQFVDLGCGLPLHSRRNVHEIAQAIAADSTTVYVDNDPLVLNHARLYLRTDQTAVVEADLADGLHPILEHPKARALLDPDRPVAVLLCSTLETLPDEALPAALLADLPSLMPAGSFVVLTHLASADEHAADRASALMRQQILGGWGRIRSHNEVAALVAGLSLLEPGLTDLSTLPPPAPAVRTALRETGPSPVTVLGAVARLDPSPATRRRAAARAFGAHNAAQLGYAAVATGTVQLDAIHPACPRLTLPDALIKTAPPAGDPR